MEKLKACPHCGGKAVFERFNNPKNWYVVRCTVCGCQTDGFHINHDDATDAQNKSANAAVWNRRAAPENKALTLFDKITESPEKLAKFLGAIDIGKIELDECFCKSDCGDDSGCPHELQCIINWLDKPAAASIRWTQK